MALIPHCWDGVADPELPRLALVAKGEELTGVTRPVVLMNSFGFGGNNCSLVMGVRGSC